MRARTKMRTVGGAGSGGGGRGGGGGGEGRRHARSGGGTGGSATAHARTAAATALYCYYRACYAHHSQPVVDRGGGGGRCQVRNLLGTPLDTQNGVGVFVPLRGNGSSPHKRSRCNTVTPPAWAPRLMREAAGMHPQRGTGRVGAAAGAHRRSLRAAAHGRAGPRAEVARRRARVPHHAHHAPAAAAGPACSGPACSGRERARRQRGDDADCGGHGVAV